MGRRGPPPKPTKLKLLAGNPGKRPINTREPKPKDGAPRCPQWLAPEAKKTWKRTVAELRRMKLLKVCDGDALASYSQTYARWKDAEEFLAQHGTVYPVRDDRGRLKIMRQFPQVAIAREQQQLMKAYQQEFGLTPSARTTLKAEYEDEFDDDYEFMMRGYDLPL